MFSARGSELRTRVHLTKLLFAASLAAAVTVLPSIGRADDDTDKAMAQSLFDAGRALMSDGNARDACPKFEESDRLDPSAGTLLNLGKCYEALGRTASAWAAYKRTVTVGKSTGQSRQVDAAVEFIGTLEPKLTKLVIEVTDPRDGLVVRRFDDRAGSKAVVISEASRNVPLAIDPGEYRIEAEAPGFERWSATVRATGEGETASLKIPALVPTKAKIESPTPPPRRNGAPGALGVAGVASASAGVVLLGIGTGLGIATLDRASNAESNPTLCPKKRCSLSGQAYIENTKKLATGSTVSLAVGGAATAAGVVLLILDVDRRMRERSAPVRPAPLRSASADWGLALEGDL